MADNENQGPEAEGPNFEQLDDLFGEDSAEVESSGDAPMPTDETPDPLGDQGGDPLGLDGLDPLGDSLGDPLEAGEGEAGLTEEETPSQASDEADDSKKKKKKKKPKKEKKKKEKKPKKPKAQKPKVEGEQSGFPAALRNTSPYTVMLALALAAVLFGIFCLLMELRAYNFDIKAEEYKQQAGVVPAVQLGPPTTAVAACPAQVRLTSSAGEVVEESGRLRIT